jgi:hypothetical protein
MPADPRRLGSGPGLVLACRTRRGHEIRIKAGSGKPYREWELMRLPVQLR